MDDQSNSNGFASRAALLGLSARRFDSITLPRSGLAVRFRSLSDGEFSSFEDAAFERDDDGKITVNDELQRNARTRLIILTVCDASGNLLFVDGDAPAVGEMDLDDSLALYDAIREHVGLTTAVKRRKAMEDRVKN